jgi:hypothetical protein
VVATLPNGSSALTVIWNGVPEYVEPELATTENCVAAAALVAIGAEVPEMDGFCTKSADTVCSPAVSSVTVNVPKPLVSAASAGSWASGSELVKCTTPLKPSTWFSMSSNATTVT